MSATLSYAQQFLKTLSGNVDLTPNLLEIFARILSRQLNEVDGVVTPKNAGTFDTLSKVFTFVATPAATRQEQGITNPLNNAVYDANKADAEQAAKEAAGQAPVDPGTPATFSLTAASTSLVAEGSDITFTITPSKAVDVETTLYVQISGAEVGAITAKASADDFSAVLLPVVIPAGSAAPVTVSTTVVEDNVTEGPEGFQAKLLNADFIPLANVATITGTITEAVGMGKTFMLTKGLDNVIGTAGNDTIIGSVDTGNAELNTISPIDTIDGGAGVDTLKISAATAFTAANMPNISNVEIIEIAGKAGVAVNTAAIVGLTNLNVTEHGSAIADVTAATTTDVAVSIKEIGDGVTTAFTNTVNGGNNVTVTATNMGTAASANPDIITVTNAAGDVVVNATGAVYTAATVNSGFGAINVTGGKTISVTQKAAANDDAAAADTTNTTITQGNVTIAGSAATTTVTVKQDAAVTAVNATNKTGGITASSNVKFGALKANDVLVVAGLTFTAAEDMTANEVAAAFANLVNNAAYGAELTTAGDTQSGGVAAKGTYTGIATGWTSGAAVGDTVLFTSTTANSNQTLTINSTGVTNGGTAPTQTIIHAGKAHDAGATGGKMGVVAGQVSITDANASIKTITVDGYGASSSTTTTTALEVLNLSNSASDFTVATTSANFALNLEKIGTSTTDADILFTASPLTLNIQSTGNNFVDLKAEQTTTLNVSGTGVLKLDENSNDDLAALAKINVTGAAGLTLGTLNTNAITSIDTTGTTGAVSATIDATASTYAGGAGKDTVTLTNTAAINKAIDLGAGDDTLKLADDTTAIPTVEVKGGAGTDTLSMTVASAVSYGGAATFASKLSGFERLTINSAAGTADGVTDTVTVNVENLGFNYVTTTGTNTGNGVRDILQLNNLANNSTVVLTADGHVQANIKDATEVANTTDVLNLVARVDTADVTHGTLTAAGVETINLTAEDISPVNPTTGAKTIQTSTLTLAADKATSINLGTSNAHLKLTLASATNKVTLIDGSNTTGNLTVQAVGATSTTIKGGSGNDVLTASQAVVSTVNATGTNAVITSDGTGTSVLGANARAEVQTLTITADDTDDNNETLTVTFGTNSVGGTGSVEVDLGAVDVTDAALVAAAVQTALNTNGAFSAVANATVDNNIITITYFATNVDYTQVTATVGGTTVELAGAGDTRVTPAAAVAQVSTVVLTDGTVNTGLSTGDTMSLEVGGTTFTYTAEDTVTMGTAGTRLAALINANAAYTAAYDDGTDTITITAATVGTAGAFTVQNYTVADAMDVAAAADKLYGGAGNDVLVANHLMTEMWGGEGNDLFVINTASLNVNSYSTIMDFQAGDLIKIDGITAFKTAKVDLGGTAVFQDLANAAVTSLALNEAGWFQHGGDTYIVADMGTNSTTTFVNGTDYIVKIAGLVDLSNASFNSEHDTIALV